MLNQLMSFDVRRILRWDVGAAIKPVLMFDVNRILFADLGQALMHPILQIAYKAVLGWMAVLMLTVLIAIVMLDTITPAVETIIRVVSLALATAFVAPDVRRLLRRRSTP